MGMIITAKMMISDNNEPEALVVYINDKRVDNLFQFNMTAIEGENGKFLMSCQVNQPKIQRIPTKESLPSVESAEVEQKAEARPAEKEPEVKENEPVEEACSSPAFGPFPTETVQPVDLGDSAGSKTDPVT